MVVRITFLFLSALTFTACGSEPRARGATPDYTVQGMPVFLEPGVEVDAETIGVQLDMFRQVVEVDQAAPGITLDTNGVELHITRDVLPHALCHIDDDEMKCLGLTTHPVLKGDTDPARIYVANIDTQCFFNNAMGHELSHLAMIQSNDLNGDGQHTQPLWWGYMGIVNSIKMRLGVSCIGGADLSHP